MPSRSKVFTSQLGQTAVYWGNPVNDGQGGYTFDTGVDIDVRWEDTQEMFIDDKGRESVSRAVVFVSRDVVVGGYLYLGALADLASAEDGDPLAVSAAYEIRKFDKIPSVDATRFTRRAWL
jgi:hypothetical protein